MIRFALALSVFLAASPATATERVVQWGFNVHVPAATDIALTGLPRMTWMSEQFPYTVPEGHCLLLTDLFIGSKFTTSGRSSYFLIENIPPVPDSVGHLRFSTPYVIPAGTSFTAHVINNDEFAQNIGVGATGVLIEQKTADCRIDAAAWSRRP